MTEPKTITSEHLSDDANHTTCECGNETIYEYVWSDDDGNQSCPLCMTDWQSSQIKAMKKLVYELSSFDKETTALQIKKKYAEIMGCDVEYIENMETDCSKIQPPK